MKDDDRDLRERFVRQRAEDAERTPEFARAWAGARQRSRPPRRWLRLVLAGVAAAVAAIGLLRVRPSPHPVPPPSGAIPPLGEWRAPTDFLLQTPGRELLTTVPRLGGEVPLLRTSPMPERSTSS